jgi:hypothetical protein
VTITFAALAIILAAKSGATTHLALLSHDQQVFSADTGYDVALRRSGGSVFRIVTFVDGGAGFGSAGNSRGLHCPGAH